MSTMTRHIDRNKIVIRIFRTKTRTRNGTKTNRQIVFTRTHMLDVSRSDIRRSLLRWKPGDAHKRRDKFSNDLEQTRTHHPVLLALLYIEKYCHE